MNKISKLALALFAITAVTNVSFGMDTQKEQNIEKILIQKKLKQLNEEKEKEEASWFNQIYLPHKPFEDHLTNIIVTGFLAQQIVNVFFVPLLAYFIPVIENNKKTTEVLVSVVIGLSQVIVGTDVQKHQTRITVHNEQIKNLEEILAEMEK